MSEPLWRKQLPAIAIGLLDVFAIGFGGGVPLFAALLGFPVGWWLARRRAFAAQQEGAPRRESMRGLMGAAGALAAVSLVVLLVIWGPYIPGAFDSSFDAARWGIPLILGTPQASAIAWLALMLIVAPALQFAAVLAGGVVGLAVRPRRPRDDAGESGQ